jgi:hypothetical protein
VKILRSVAAVVAGYAVIATILRAFATDNFPLTLAWTIAGAIAAGFTAAFIAGRHEIPHAAGVGFLMIAMSLWHMRRQGIAQPGWFETTVAGCGPIACMIGAALRMLTKRSKTEKPPDRPAADNPPSASPSNPSASPH